VVAEGPVKPERTHVYVSVPSALRTGPLVGTGEAPTKSSAVGIVSVTVIGPVETAYSLDSTSNVNSTLWSCTKVALSAVLWMETSSMTTCSVSLLTAADSVSVVSSPVLLSRFDVARVGPGNVFSRSGIAAT